jgi:hypothetical protein
MVWVWIIFGLPFAATVVEWIVLGTRRRDQLRHVTVVIAMIFSTASSGLGVWSLFHVHQLVLRARTDYGIEKTGWLLAAIGVFAAITWVSVERNRFSWLTLAISMWMFLIWALACLSL